MEERSKSAADQPLEGQTVIEGFDDLAQAVDRLKCEKTSKENVLHHAERAAALREKIKGFSISKDGMTAEQEATVGELLYHTARIREVTQEVNPNDHEKLPFEDQLKAEIEYAEQLAQYDFSKLANDLRTQLNGIDDFLITISSDMAQFQGINESAYQELKAAADQISSYLSDQGLTQDLIRAVANRLQALTPNEITELKKEISTPDKKKRPARNKGDGILDRIIKESYVMIYQNKTTNQMTKLLPNSKGAEFDKITGTLSFRDGDHDLLRILKYDALPNLRTSTWQMLDLFLLKLTNHNRDPAVKVSLEEYMKARNLTDRKEAKKQARADFDVLRSMSVNLATYEKGKETQHGFINIAEKGYIDKYGNMTFHFTETYIHSIVSQQIMPYSPALIALDNRRNPNSYMMGRKILELKNMNVLHKTAGNVVSVKTLLENAPNISQYDDVKNRKYHEKIIVPFERDLDALDSIFTWEYCHSNGKPLTDTELESFTYDIFIGCNVKITWRDYPDQTARKERLENKLAKTKEKSEKLEKIRAQAKGREEARIEAREREESTANEGSE